MSNIIKLNPEIREAIIESGGQDVIKCYQCGRCMAACPWNLLDGVSYTTYRFCQRIRLGAIIDSEDKEDIATDTIDVFRCVGCDSCKTECPRGVGLSDVLRAVRRILVDYDSYPAASHFQSSYSPEILHEVPPSMFQQAVTVRRDARNYAESGHAI